LRVARQLMQSRLSTHSPDGSVADVDEVFVCED
jgi:hypothetical protein